MKTTRRATAALIAATATLALTAPADADHTVTQPRKTTTNYGSGTWTGPIGSPTQTGNIHTAAVALYGDSISNRCTPDIRTALAAEGKTLYTFTWPSQNIAGLTDAMTTAIRQPPDVIMAAGTNDAFNPFAAPAAIARAKAFLNQTDSELYWVDTYVGRPAYLADDVRNSGQVNAAITAAIAPDHVIGWLPALTAARGRGRPSSYYLQDGVHPWISAGTNHGDGCAFLAAIIAGALP